MSTLSYHLTSIPVSWYDESKMTDIVPLKRRTMATLDEDRDKLVEHLGTAISALVAALDSGSERIKLDAVKLIMEYTLGKPKTHGMDEDPEEGEKGSMAFILAEMMKEAIAQGGGKPQLPVIYEKDGVQVLGTLAEDYGTDDGTEVPLDRSLEDDEQEG